MWHGSGYIGYVDERQLKWLEADLSQVERGRTVIVFTHVPLLCTQHRRLKQSAPSVSQVVTNRLAIYRLLEGYKAHVMSGHTHENEHVLEQGVHEHIHGAVCGAWWTGPVCFDGTPKGYGVYEVRGEELRWHYKSTGQPSTHQMRIYAPGSDPRQPGVLIANVWNWDPKWQVVWYEDGEQRPPMEQYTAQDPMSVGLYGGPALPATRQWVEPMTTAHLFRCTPAAHRARSPHRSHRSLRHALHRNLAQRHRVNRHADTRRPWTRRAHHHRHPTRPAGPRRCGSWNGATARRIISRTRSSSRSRSRFG